MKLRKSESSEFLNNSTPALDIIEEEDTVQEEDGIEQDHWLEDFVMNWYGFRPCVDIHEVLCCC